MDKLTKSSPLLVLGNAKSLAKFPFYNYKMHTMGMNIAFRFWHQIGWYPTYYLSLDRNINMKYGHELNFLVINRDKFGIKGFLFRKELGDRYPHLKNIKEVYFLEDLNQPKKRGFNGDSQVTSGSHSIRWGIYMGYKKVYILGIDANYVELKNKSKITTKENRLTETVLSKANDNYFFDGYQRKGDPLHISRRKGEKRNQNHLDIFRKIDKEFNQGKQKIVFNANPKSRLNKEKILPLEIINSKYLKGSNENPISFDWQLITNRIISSHPPLLLMDEKPISQSNIIKPIDKTVVKPIIKTVVKPIDKPKKNVKKSKKNKIMKKPIRKNWSKVVGKVRTGRNFRIIHKKI